MFVKCKDVFRIIRYLNNPDEGSSVHVLDDVAETWIFYVGTR